MTPCITIWIHGTMPEYLVPYITTIESIHDFFYCKPGLHKADTYDPKYHHFDIAKTLAATDPQRFPFEHFYIFGWSGKLDSNERLRAALLVYQEIQSLFASYKKSYKIEPVIRIITHSHGGNVALNLTRAIDFEASFVIKDLIVLAVPVQQETANFIKNPLFNSIYSLHSHWDLLQVADPQGWPSLRTTMKGVFKMLTLDAFKNMMHSFEETELFSKRHFQHYQRLVQAHVHYDHRNLLHIEFLMLPFLEQLGTILNDLEKKLPNTNTEVEDVDYILKD